MFFSFVLTGFACCSLRPGSLLSVLLTKLCTLYVTALLKLLMMMYIFMMLKVTLNWNKPKHIKVLADIMLMKTLFMRCCINMVLLLWQTLTKKGFNVKIEENAGVEAKFTNDSYVAAGASLTDAKGAFDSDIVLKVCYVY